ncbi:uncharacterized protein SETTUDRAFT_106486 [Exserohilum turcica Et28A]|uniref:Uncharacterized protein n=1 Tax=Exserohilum turcicum (strain 28A) TaxID=671987 RepID=R0IWE9_EXST2|nr:uncharacterized protein SETTUDRAFT_106486 [Exserohilum turcica Et28A]EOA88941.1 hypothetical protein SETTUDRAFT_106486 [Exserohilum turcica Et28A]
MPALPTTTPISQHDHNRRRLDWPLIWAVICVASILVFQILLILCCIRVAISRSKARWARLRDQGVVVVDGPTLIWMDTMPPAPTVSTFNLRQMVRWAEERS